jgi:threonine aldolase
MRQAGIIAAAGIVSLTSMVERLKQDHLNAHTLALGLADIPGIEIDPADQHTNMVYFCLSSPQPSLGEFRRQLAGYGLLVGGGSDRIRMVTHAWVDEDDVAKAVEIIQKAMI